MKSTELIERLHKHRRWVNQGLLQAAAKLNGHQLQQEFPMGQGSIWKSLTHLYGAEFVWLEALLGNEQPIATGDAVGKLPGNQDGEKPIGGLAELKTRWEELESRWSTYVSSLTSASLKETIYKRNSVTGERIPNRRVDILIHVCTHAQYTTAQVMNMLRHVGVETLPDTMLTAYARDELFESD